MKGYVLLTVLSLLIVLTAPLSALPDKPAPPAAETPTENTADTKDTATFRVKNEKTGDVLTLSEEDFLVAVVSCEMAPSSPVEALKAQTVAAYTYYCKQRAASPDGIFSNVPETLFTVGTEKGMRERFGDQYDKWHTLLTETVRAVKGQKLLYNGEPITACYHAISAGLTERAADVWGGDYPYLQPVDSAGDLTAKGYETTVAVAPDKLTAALLTLESDFKADGDPAAWFQNADTTKSGFVKTVAVGNKTFTGGKLRTALGLRSACFTVQYKDGSFVFTVHGYGHNVGMSQTGAKYMANAGADYTEILAHYYPGTTLQ